MSCESDCYENYLVALLAAAAAWQELLEKQPPPSPQELLDGIAAREEAEKAADVAYQDCIKGCKKQ